MKSCKIMILPFLILLVLSSCDMAYTNDWLNNFANGAQVPSDFAIASGDFEIMSECLNGLRLRFQSGEISEYERSTIALDMIDLLAVMSKAIVTLEPYLIGDKNPAELNDLSMFFESSDKDFLATITEERLMEVGIFAGPSPMQLFWSILGMYTYEEFNSGDYASMMTSDSYMAMVDEAVRLADEITNPAYLMILDQFRFLLDELASP